MAKQIRPYGYWTDERVIEESKKYKTRIEFKENSSTACKIAYKRKLIDGMTWLKTDRHKKRGPRKDHKYTKEIVLSLVREHNCVTFADLRKLNEYAYNQAKDNDWLDELGLIRNKHEDGYWTKDTVLKVARNYDNKNMFRKSEPTAYKWASEYDLLDKMDWMKPLMYEEIKDKRIYVVYVYEDVENKVAYVGLTKDNNSRKRSHKYDKSVGAYFGSEIPEPIILKEKLTVTESQYFEDYYKKQYKRKGYHLLNKAKTGVNIGSIGGIVKWTKDTVFEESRKYNSRSEFQREASGAYGCAKHNKWLDQMTWLTTPEREVFWTHDAVIKESRKYKYKCDFRDNAGGAHQTASENGWLAEMTWLIDKKRPHNYWTKERVFEESHKYTNKKDFENKSKGAFLKAMNKGWLAEMTWLKPLPLGPRSIWTREAIIEESKKYTSRTEFAQNSPTAYQHACEDKTIFNEMPWIKEKKKPDGYWNKESRISAPIH